MEIGLVLLKYEINVKLNPLHEKLTYEKLNSYAGSIYYIAIIKKLLAKKLF